jgi:nitrogen-specific signal transduction histidine kinase/CheY-like chemotaxis protein
MKKNQVSTINNPGTSALSEQTNKAADQAQDIILNQERMKAAGHLAAGIAHDFNNLLQGITGYAELVMMDHSLKHITRNRVQNIMNQADKASGLIRQILDFSRRSVSEKKPLSMLPFLRETILNLKKILPDNIKIIFNFEDVNLWINGDNSRLHQALYNIAENASDVMPDGGCLSIDLSMITITENNPAPFPGMNKGDWVLLKISDTGCGIPEEIIPRIFEPFYTTKSRTSVSGLGLSQVYGIIKQHESFIDVKTEIAKGTQFYIYLPSITQKTEQSTIRADKFSGHGENILLVDDNPVVLEVTREMLKYLNYKVETAKNGREALTRYNKCPDKIALVLSDMAMPLMGGDELFRKLRKINPGIKVIIMTGYPAGREARNLLASGIVDWLQKPLDTRKLATAINHALYGKKMIKK